MSWEQLQETAELNRQFLAEELSRPPLSCPNDGTPLQVSPPGYESTMFCPHDGYQWPADPSPLRPGGL